MESGIAVCRHGVSMSTITARAGEFTFCRHYACCLGDTLASELGILSRGRPRLVTTLQPVPPGTNGGMSVAGTLASILGGALIGVLMALTLTAENSRCRENWSAVVLSLFIWGAFAGFFGSLVRRIRVEGGNNTNFF